MELRQLRHFLALADHKNFRRAAESVGLTQQALSQSIAQLERQNEAKLFDRGKFGASLTEIGIAFEKRARLICAELELAHLEMIALRGGVSGQLSIGANSAVATTVMPQVLRRFAQQRPKVTVTLTVDHSRVLYDRLLGGDIELAISTPAQDWGEDDKVDHERLGRGFAFDANYLVMRSGHPLLGANQPSLRESRKYPWILPDRFSAFTAKLLGYFEAQGVSPPDYVLRTGSILCALSLLADSDFVAMVGRDATTLALTGGRLAGFALPDFDFKLWPFLSKRKTSTLQPAAHEFVATLRSVIAGLETPAPGAG